MRDILQTVSLLTALIMAASMASAAPSSNTQSDSVMWKGQPDMLYLSDGDKRRITAVGNNPQSFLTPDNINLENYDRDSFQACVSYVELDVRRWSNFGPLDTDCYNYQQFQSLLERGELPPLSSN